MLNFFLFVELICFILIRKNRFVFFFYWNLANKSRYNNYFCIHITLSGELTIMTVILYNLIIIFFIVTQRRGFARIRHGTTSRLRLVRMFVIHLRFNRMRTTFARILWFNESVKNNSYFFILLITLGNIKFILCNPIQARLLFNNHCLDYKYNISHYYE